MNSGEMPRCRRVYDEDGFGKQRCTEAQGHDGNCGTNWEWVDAHPEGN